MELFFQLLLCSLALFGLWCALRLICESLLGSRCIAPSVTVRTREELSAVAQLLEEAKATLSCRRASRIVLLFDRSLTEGGQIPPALLCACRRHGAVCYLVDLSKDATDGKFENQTKGEEKDG